MSPDRQKGDLRRYECWVSPLLVTENLFIDAVPPYVSEAFQASLTHSNAEPSKRRKQLCVLDLHDDNAPEFVIDRDTKLLSQGRRSKKFGGLICLVDINQFPKKGKSDPGIERLSQMIAWETDHGSFVTVFCIGGKDMDAVDKWKAWLKQKKLYHIDPRSFHLTINGDHQPVTMISSRRLIPGEPEPSDINTTEFRWPLTAIKSALKEMSGYKVELGDWIKLGEQSRRHLTVFNKMVRGAGLRIVAEHCGCSWVYDENGNVAYSSCGKEDCQGDPGLEAIIDKAVKIGWRNPLREPKRKKKPVEVENKGELLPDLIRKYPSGETSVMGDLMRLKRSTNIGDNWTERGFRFVRVDRLSGRYTFRIIRISTDGVKMPDIFWRTLKPGDIIKKSQCSCYYVALDVGFINTDARTSLGDSIGARYVVERVLVRFRECLDCAEERVVVK